MRKSWSGRAEGAAPQTQDDKGLIENREDFGREGWAMEPTEWGQPDADERPYGAVGSHGGMRVGNNVGGGRSIQEECMHSQGAKADSGGQGSVPEGRGPESGWTKDLEAVSTPALSPGYSILL